jgi:hypothetical protein
MKGKMILPVLAVMLLSVAAVGAVKTYAIDSQNNHSSIVQKLVQKFGLKESDVQAVFNEARQERQASMRVKFEERIDQAVKKGELTEVQKQKILAKHKEIQAGRLDKPENWQNLSREERQAKMQIERQELESWAKDNDIDMKYFFGGGRMKVGGRFK